MQQYYNFSSMLLPVNDVPDMSREEIQLAEKEEWKIDQADSWKDFEREAVCRGLLTGKDA